jgi:hypothetical protein
LNDSCQLDPALKNWLDRVLVPALVSQYLREMRQKDFAVDQQ